MSRRRPPRADPARIAELDAVYAELPTIDCKGLCQESCGPIVQARSTTAQELLRMQDSGGERRGKQRRQPLTCPYLTAEDETGRCSIYESRPGVCRLWGIVDSPLMRCPHGCEATEILSDRAGAMVMIGVSPAPTEGRSGRFSRMVLNVGMSEKRGTEYWLKVGFWILPS
ncbi:MAG: YkgJ family cysteine cluster protein [Armatimonadetes bacterium]|nr:YkgJ family cysteine cluster protein [Armatimonadota bacterium]